MSHEHDGHCCGQQEARIHQHSHIERIGQLCCQGVCAHPEHQQVAAQQIQQMYLELQREQDKNTETKPATKKRTSKKRAALNLTELLFNQPKLLKET